MKFSAMFEKIPGSEQALSAVRKAAAAVDQAAKTFDGDPSGKTINDLRRAVKLFIKELTTTSRGEAGASAEFKVALKDALAACKDVLQKAEDRLAATSGPAAPTGDARLWLGKMSASSKAAKVLKDFKIDWEKVLEKAASSALKGAKGLTEAKKADQSDYRFSALLSEIDAASGRVECTLLADLTESATGRSLGHGLGHKSKAQGSSNPDDLLEAALESAMKKLVKQAVASKVQSERGT